MTKVNLTEKLKLVEEHWSPKTVARMNNYDIQVVKVKGEFVWHRHDNADDCFLVLKGRLRIQMREGDVELGPGELFVVPKAVEHCPKVDDEVHLLLIEPTGTLNTGDAGG